MIQIVKIKKIVESCLEYVQTDFESKNNEKDSFLYKVLGDTQDGSYNFYEQAKNLFLRKGIAGISKGQSRTSVLCD